MDASKIKNNKKAIYSVIAFLIIILAGLAIYLNYAGAARTADIKFDNVAVTQSNMASLENISKNMSLADAIGLGAATNYPVSANTKINLSSSGKPEVLYIGADYCPFCAITRWGMIIAFMRFGNFSDLHYMTSSATDYSPNTATFTFYNSSYHSSYFSFVPVETLTNTYKTLQPLTANQTAIIDYFDVNGSIPFIDFANKTVQIGAESSPEVINPGGTNPYNWSYVISELNNPNSAIAQGIIGEANMYTAQICSIDGGKPASVCSQKFVSLGESLS
ncbi:DUF929 domain-containing protein [Candidatus Marsarchaeota archaeon]|nr:DUF929 domain-containing protein [Candidatus Marsarchaeota archaeon]MCL5404899.1 DUF929 domain-containing protein [Candidatus Marsarchaeota archaeon]